MDLVHTASCTLVPQAPEHFYELDGTETASKKATLASASTKATLAQAEAPLGKYDMDPVHDWLQQRGYLDEQSRPEEELQKYKKICKDESLTEPQTVDGLNIEGIDNGVKMCTSKDTKYDYFDDYIADQALADSFEAVGEDKLGLEGSDSVGAGSSEGKSYSGF